MCIPTTWQVSALYRHSGTKAWCSFLCLNVMQFCAPCLSAGLVFDPFVPRYAARAVVPAMLTAQLLRVSAKYALACLMFFNAFRIALGWPAIDHVEDGGEKFIALCRVCVCLWWIRDHVILNLSNSNTSFLLY